MTTLDDIAARDAGRAEDDTLLMSEDRRYLLGLVREAREALQSLAEWPTHGVLLGRDAEAMVALARAALTEGSDRT